VIGPKKAGVLGFLGCFIETLCAAFLFPAEEGHVFFLKLKLITNEARAITEALKTLKVEDGRVSIDPSEVIGRPGYLDERSRVGAMVCARQQASAPAVSWDAVDQLTFEAFSKALALSLVRSREAGLGVEQALTNLRYVLANTRASL
jgi:hypothetical protein